MPAPGWCQPQVVVIAPQTRVCLRVELPPGAGESRDGECRVARQRDWLPRLPSCCPCDSLRCLSRTRDVRILHAIEETV